MGQIQRGTPELVCRAATLATFNTFLSHYKVDPVALTTVQFACSVMEGATHKKEKKKRMNRERNI